MKRSEFLKRLGLGAVAAVAAPALLKGEEKEIESACNHVDAKEGEELAFRPGDETARGTPIRRQSDAAVWLNEPTWDDKARWELVDYTCNAKQNFSKEFITQYKA